MNTKPLVVDADQGRREQLARVAGDDPHAARLGHSFSPGLPVVATVGGVRIEQCEHVMFEHFVGGLKRKSFGYRWLAFAAAPVTWHEPGLVPRVGPEWCIVHLPTGLALPYSFAGPRTAVLAMKEIGKLSNDWSAFRSFDEDAGTRLLLTKVYRAARALDARGHSDAVPLSAGERPMNGYDVVGGER